MKLFKQTMEIAKKHAENDLLWFNRFYLSSLFSLPVPACHLEIKHFLDEGHPLSLIVFPREHGKTTWEMGQIIHDICYQKEKYIVIFGSSAGRATQVVANIKHEFKTNQRIIEDFGQLVDSSEKDTESDIIFRNGIRLQAFGAGASARGLNHRGQRPTRIWLDDIESAEKMRSQMQRDKLFEWINRDIVPMTDNLEGKIVFIGNRLHMDDAISRCMDNPAWKHIYYKAIKENGESLWPEKWPIEKLLERKATVGNYAFTAEYLNTPIDEETAVFRYEWLQFHNGIGWDHLEIYGAIDPAISTKDSADWFVFITIGIDKTTKRIYILDVYRKRDTLANHVSEVCNRYEIYGHTKLGIEENAAQKAIKELILIEAKARNLRIPLHGIINTKDKYLRIVSKLQPIFERREVSLNKQRHSALIDELVSYDVNATHDDQLDALEMAVRMSEKRPVRIMKI